MEHRADAAPQSRLAGSAGESHPGQGFHGVGAFVRGEVVDGGAQVVGGGVVGEAEPADRGGQPDLGCLCRFLPLLADPCAGRRVGVGAGGFGGGEDQGRADDRVRLDGEPGAEGSTDRVLVVGGGGQCVGGLDADLGVGVVEQGMQECGVRGDRGPGRGDRPARRVAGHLDAVVVAEVVVPGVAAVEQQFLAGGDAEVAGAGRGGCLGERAAAVRVAGVGGDPDEERYGEHGCGPDVVGAHAAHDTRTGADGRVAGVQQVNGLPDEFPVWEVLPGDFAEQESVLGPGPHGGHDGPHVVGPASEGGQLRSARQSPAHRERRIGTPLAHVAPPPPLSSIRIRSCLGGPTPVPVVAVARVPDMTTFSVDQSWDRIETWLAQHAAVSLLPLPAAAATVLNLRVSVRWRDELAADLAGCVRNVSGRGGGAAGW
ncbi:hypothetical protein [Streptomyces erythrochromogenes]|uniref:hypothetical protein n=1 Tax=Streptomyces erythrochromogenes TaxID=285574 RepID=UPI00382C9106